MLTGEDLDAVTGDGALIAAEVGAAEQVHQRFKGSEGVSGRDDGQLEDGPRKFNKTSEIHSKYMIYVNTDRVLVCNIQPNEAQVKRYFVHLFK